MSLVMDKYDALDSQEHDLRHFSFIFGVSQFLGALAVILMAVWMGSYDAEGGFAWNEPIEPGRKHDKQFHYHPLFMSVGFIFLYGEAILIYRVFRHESKRLTKPLHAALNGLVLIFVIVALEAVFQAHNREGGANMYTIHSWLGIGAVLIFSFQLLAGFVSFVFPGLSMGMRKWYMPIHRFTGTLGFGLVVTVALMGISERAAFHTGDDWKNFKPQGITLNIAGLSVALYGILVIYLVGNPKFQRKPLPEEESLHQLSTAD